MKKPKQQTCANCANCRPIEGSIIECRANPPTITKVEGNTVTSNWPLLKNDQWCGAWKLVTTR